MKRLALILAIVASCSRKEETKPEPAKPHLEFLRAEPGEIVAQQVVSERAKAKQRGRTMLVYIGATWCEPCQRFHKAAQSGALDKEFPTLTLLEYDLDIDGSRLSKAGYAPGYIPYFGIPGDDGKATTQAVAGSIKGEGAVDDITPKLHTLLGDSPL
jgi:thiol-disulfide isomerase/thioredoxin